MIVGIPKEIKPQENRVSMTPSGVDILASHGHTVLVEKKAGMGSGFKDRHYADAGAVIVNTLSEVYDTADMVMHVKEPQPSEFHLIKKDQIVFTYLHLAADKDLTLALLKTGSVGIAYETIEDRNHRLPVLTPMSEVAGRLAVQQGAKYLEKTFGGSGILLGGVTGTPAANVMVIGGGVVGIQAAQIACGMGANVTILDTDIDRLRYLSEIMPANCRPLMSSPALVKKLAKGTDLIIGAVLVAGAKAPKLITKDMLKTMKKGSVIVDVAIDQGGCFETSRPTTHSNPIFEVDGIIHYCVTNMPGSVPLTSTIALTNATLPYALKIADNGWKSVCKTDPGFAKGINYVGDKIVCKPVADAFDMNYTPLDKILQV
ncbi:MAG: alanine dehydrogenase [Proteobacteria bacterium]|nr:alanine dehydrogenase [Pseudomonadota bacterium]MBU1386373.1 alanine dehydrogenase [Pseudomonadota bacterium]MBU1544484.1 alanine dehydrogenase [Pseudomonadota bacterium]MBU2429515.1 alanine dehydrogenase [Pseudomonadota bacterium]MBU2480337.1 alanine dehydrogenase [Pseudomonadota bacterium]